MLIGKACCMLSNATFDIKFQAKIVNATRYLVNQSPSTTIVCNIPYKVWSGHSVIYFDLRIFGYPTYIHMNDGKLVLRAKRYIFLHYANGVKEYKL